VTAAPVAPEDRPDPGPRAARAVPGRGRRDDYAHAAPALAAYAALPPGDPRRREMRDLLATLFWPVVVRIARRYRGRGEPLADLEQVGAVGLLGALDRFRPDHGTDFLAFAVPTITGEIRRHFRDSTWSMHVPRRLKDLQTPIREAVAELTTTTHRAPRPSEIAAHLGTSVEEVVEALAAQHAYTPSSLDAPAGDGGTGHVDLLGEVDAALATAGYRHELRRALADLPERERTIVALRFFGDLTQTQIAAEVGLSQMHVSRLLSRTLAVLRERIDAT
jgi:RNA polymerase sigma-B factor